MKGSNDMLEFFVHIGVEGQVGQAGQTCAAQHGEDLLACLRRHGFEVPSLCHHPGLSNLGACRLCLVEVERKGQRNGRRKLTTSCNHPVLEGMHVYLDTPKVIRHRRVVLELLMAASPEASQLRDLAASLGIEDTRFEKKTDADKCILCGLCSRVCVERVGAEAVVLSGRGKAKYLSARPFGEFPETCIGCGACAHLCPTGAISMEGAAVERLRFGQGPGQSDENNARPCRYSLMGLASGSVCENDYRCSSCEVDQRMVDLAGGQHPIFLKRSAGQRGRYED